MTIILFCKDMSIDHKQFIARELLYNFCLKNSCSLMIIDRTDRRTKFANDFANVKSVWNVWIIVIQLNRSVLYRHIAEDMPSMWTLKWTIQHVRQREEASPFNPNNFDFIIPEQYQNYIIEMVSYFCIMTVPQILHVFWFIQHKQI